MTLLGMFPVSPFQMAVFGGNTNIELVKLLAGRGADVNQRDGDGVTPLSWAVLGDQAAMARALIALGAEVNYVDKLGMTPLLYAANVDYGNTELIRVLLSAGADRSARTKEDATAVEQARRYGHTAIERSLE